MKNDKKYTLIGLDIEWNNVILSKDFDKWEIHHYMHNSFRKMIEVMIERYKIKKREKLNITRRSAYNIKLCEYKALYKNVERTNEVYSVCIKEVNMERLKKLIEGGINDLHSMYQCIEKTFFLKTMKSALNFIRARYKDRVICYCHNLNAEFSSILTETEGNDVKNTKKVNAFGTNPSTSVFRDKNTPLSVTLEEYPNINFKCSYALTNKSIETLGKEFTKEFKRLGYDINFKKLKYEYEKYRSPLEERTSEEKKYNERDVDISLLAVIKECIIRKCDVTELPLTFTSGIRKDRDKYIQEYVEKFTNLKNAKYYLNILSKEKEKTRIEDFQFYDLIYYTRQGGLTTSNFEFTGVMNHNVFSYDIKSSYPYQMVFKEFPLYTKESTFYCEGEEGQEVFNFVKNKTIKDLQKGKIKGFTGIFTIENIKSICDSNILCISKAKLINYSSDIKCINGKLFSASWIRLRLNESDFDGIKNLYSFTDVKLERMYYTTKLHRINTAERFFLMKNFLIKEKMPKESVEYALSKVRINGMYGIKNQVEIRGPVDISNGVVTYVPFDEKIPFEKREEIYGNFLDDTNINRNYDIFSDGMYIPSYAKSYLIKTIVKIEKEITNEVKKINKNYVCRILYCDTDSIKFTVKRKKISTKQTTYSDILTKHNSLVSSIITYVFEKHNEKIIEENKRFLLIHCKEFLSTYNVLEKEIKTLSKLGTFDCENFIDNKIIIPYQSFITLGAKKYAYITEAEEEEKRCIKLITKIAGCSTKVSKAIIKHSELEGNSLEESLRYIFVCGMKFDETCSGRTVAYKEKHTKEELKEKGIIGAGGMHIEKTSYTLNITSDDKATIMFVVEDFEEDVLSLSSIATNNIDKHGVVSVLSYR